jgi:hypothetical protein
MCSKFPDPSCGQVSCLSIHVTDERSHVLTMYTSTCVMYVPHAYWLCYAYSGCYSKGYGMCSPRIWVRLTGALLHDYLYVSNGDDVCCADICMFTFFKNLAHMNGNLTVNDYT